MVMITHCEVPGKEPDAGVGVHLTPRLIKLVVSWRADPVALDVVSGGHDKVAIVEQAPSSHGRGNLVLVVMARTSVSYYNEAYFFICPL